MVLYMLLGAENRSMHLKVNTDDKQRYKAQLLVLKLDYYFDDNKNNKYHFSDVMLVHVDPTYNVLMVKHLLWYVLHMYT